MELPANEARTELLALQTTIETYCQTPYSFSTLIGKLEQAKQTAVPGSASVVEAMNEAVNQNLVNKSGVFTINRADGEYLQRSCDEIRCLQIIDAIPTKIQISVESPNRKPADSPYIRSLANDRTGIRFSKVNDKLIVLVPPITSELHCELILAELIELFDLNHGSEDWIVDFSRVTSLPSRMFLGNMAFHKKSLAKRNAKLLIVWLKSSALDSSLGQSFVSAFGLQNTNGYLFSDSLNE